MSASFSALRAEVLSAYRVALSTALPPKSQVARHWETPDRLEWLALLPTIDGFHLAYSLGRLHGAPVVEGERHTSGLFRLSGAVFRGVDEAALLRAVSALVPEGADGPTRAFLVRVVAQVVAAEVAVALEAGAAALPMPAAPSFACHLAARADALFQPAATPRLPGHAQDRVRAALAEMDSSLSARLQALFDSPEEALLDAVRLLGALRA